MEEDRGHGARGMAEEEMRDMGCGVGEKNGKGGKDQTKRIMGQGTGDMMGLLEN